MRHSFGLLLVCCFFAGSVRESLAQQPEVVEASVAAPSDSSLERMLTITFDLRQTAAKELGELFKTGPIVRRAARRVWKDKEVAYVHVQEFHGGRRVGQHAITFATTFYPNLQTVGDGNAGVLTGTLAVYVAPSTDEKTLEQFITALNEQVLAVLRSRASALHEQAAQERNELEKQLAMLNDELSRRREQKQQLVKSLGGDLQPREVLLDSIQQLQRERQSLELEIVSMNVRIEGLEKQIAVNREKAQHDTDKNEALENLEQVVKEREKQLEMIEQLNAKSGNNAVSKTELSKARQEVLVAKVQLAQAKSDEQKSSEGRIEHLVGQLAQNSLDLSVAEARLKHANQQLEENLERLRTQEGVTVKAQQLDGEIERLIRAQQQIALPSPIQARTVEASIKIEDIDLEPEAEQAAPDAKEAKSE